jgi:ABC-type oligopeptide transport system substrate-binding subunit
MSVYYGFNVNNPPFNNALVRQAFAAAIDREQIAQEAAGFYFPNVTPATSLTPPQVLGRDLYGEVGIPFNPSKARDLLQQAGYTSVASFPSVTLFVSTRGEMAPGAYYRMAESIVSMWEIHLGIKVTIEVSAGGYDINRLRTNPPEMYQLGWGADYNDPDNFLKGLFHSNNELNVNFGHFSNQEFDRLVEKAAMLNDPAERQLLYIQAEQILTEQEAGVIPLFHAIMDPGNY